MCTMLQPIQVSQLGGIEFVIVKLSASTDRECGVAADALGGEACSALTSASAGSGPVGVCVRMRGGRVCVYPRPCLFL